MDDGEQPAVTRGEQRNHEVEDSVVRRVDLRAGHAGTGQDCPHRAQRHVFAERAYACLIQAVKGIDLEVGQGELVTRIGANGAGKTTTMKAITGLKAYSAGDIEYMGQSIKDLPAHELLKRGLATVPEGRGIFAHLSTVENMQMGPYMRNDKDQIEKDVDRMFGFLAAETADAGDGARDHLANGINAA